MRKYWGPATLIVGEVPFEIKCAVDEGQGRPGEPVRAGLSMYGMPPWGGYFELLDPGREDALHAALSENPKATLRAPDGREATVAILDGNLIQSADGRWLE